MNVLSLFDGMSCGQIALNRVGIAYENYFASEIDPHAIKVTQHNFPNTKQIGSVTDVRGKDLPKIDLLFGGSPCQGFSFAGKQLNFDDPRSALFFEFVRVLNETKPTYFLLENVNMKKEYQDVISGLLGVEPIKIDSVLLSAGNRVRLYWTNIPNVEQPEAAAVDPATIIDGEGFPSRCDLGRNFFRRDVFNTLTATYYKGIRGSNRPAVSVKEGNLDDDKASHRMLSPLECERLHTVPENYTAAASNTQRYRMLGNGWTVDVIAHIFKDLDILL